MALNITTIRKQGITAVVVKKECQIYNVSSGKPFLANQIKNWEAHACWATSYPNATDPARILRVGTPLEIIGSGKAEERYSCAFIRVRGQGHDFDVLSKDIGRFLEV
jgi:hypothetical protein